MHLNKKYAMSQPYWFILWSIAISVAFVIYFFRVVNFSFFFQIKTNVWLKLIYYVKINSIHQKHIHDIMLFLFKLCKRCNFFYIKECFSSFVFMQVLFYFSKNMKRCSKNIDTEKKNHLCSFTFSLDIGKRIQTLIRIRYL